MNMIYSALSGASLAVVLNDKINMTATRKNNLTCF